MSDNSNSNNVDQLANQLADQQLDDGSAQNGSNQYNPAAAAPFNPGQSQQPYHNQQQQQQYNQYYNQQQQYYNNNQQQQYYNQQQQYYNNNQQQQYYANNSNNNGGYQKRYNNYNKNYNNTGNNKNYNNGYNNNNYRSNGNNYNTNSAPKGMTLDDYKKQSAEPSASAATPAVAKPKRVLKLTSSSGIKISAQKKPEPKQEVEESKKEVEQSKKEVEQPKKEVEQPKKEVEQPKKEVEQPKKEVEQPKKEVEESKKVVEEPKKVVEEPKKSASNSQIKAQVEDTAIDPEVESELFGRKETMSVIFMGHVDAGKSTLSGNVLFLTGSVDKRTVEKYEKEAKDASRQGWYLSWIMDTNKEERNEGKTVETGKAYFETEKRKYTILDAPGHKMYVSEMIGGASQADVGILVISARKGEFEAGFEKGGQTKEHAVLAKVQGVEKLVVAINKLDDDSVNWSEKRYKECVTKLKAYLKGVGFDVKKNVYFLPVSGYTGAGIKDRVTDLSYYDGPSLLEYLDSLEVPNRSISAPLMIPISGKMKDLGTVVEGKIASGHVKKGDSLLMMPNRVSIEVLNIYTETEAENDMAKSGEQVRLKIRGIEEEDISAGYVVTSPKAPVKTATKFECQLAIVELKSILSAGFSCVMHIHTAIEEVNFVALLHKLQKGTNRKSKLPPPFAKKGMRIIAVLETTEPVCMETYEDYPQLGRFTLRDQGTTIAIGKVTKILN